jgi:hypothetical protein
MLARRIYQYSPTKGTAKVSKFAETIQAIGGVLKFYYCSRSRSSMG